MQSESEAEHLVKTKMESLRLICDSEIPLQQRRLDAFASSFRLSLDSVKDRAQETVQNQAKLARLKADLREAEDELVKVLAAKTRKEASQMAVRDSISATKARIEELKRTAQVQRVRRDEYGAIISQQSHALATAEENAKQDVEQKEEIQEAIKWYNQVLGFQIEGGHGVKFTFKDINPSQPNTEYSLTIRHANDTYTLLECDPHLDNTKELIQELNRTNGLFKFVRIMRELFQEAATHGLSPQVTSLLQDSSTISASAPVMSVSTDTSESPAKKNEHQMLLGEVNRQYKKANHGNESPAKRNGGKLHVEEVQKHLKEAKHGRGAKSVTLSPGSAFSLRRSPRFKVKK